jgi:glycine/D-amino acid oxidase-like deaminating enzyme
MSEVDVLVVGGGLVGCATAYELAKRGVRVRLVERDRINAGASSRNAGSLHFQIEPRMAPALRAKPELLRQLIPISRQAQDDWRSLSSVLGADLEVEMHGGVVVGETADDRAVLERKVALENEVGLATCMVGEQELRRLIPALAPGIAFGAWCADEGHGNPRLVTPAYANAAARAGAEIRVGAEVTELAPRNRGWSARLRDVSRGSPDEVAAAKVVIACGAWSTPLLAGLGLAAPLRPIGLTMSISERSPPLLGAMIQHVGRRLSIKQLRAGNLVMGGSWPARLHRASNEDWPRSAIVDQDAILGNLQVARHVVPAVADLHLIRSWSGIASDTPDHLPLLGPLLAAPGVYVAAGGSSFTLGPTYARLLAELICTGRSALPLDVYRPERFQDGACRAA